MTGLPNRARTEPHQQGSGRSNAGRDSLKTLPHGRGSVRTYPVNGALSALLAELLEPMHDFDNLCLVLLVELRPVGHGHVVRRGHRLTKGGES